MDNQTFFLNQEFNDFEAYCENARHWDLDYYQLDNGIFFSKRLMFGNNKMVFARATLGRRMLQSGATPSGLITFGILAKPDINIHWRNHDICGDKLFVFPPSGELYSVTQPDFDVFALSLSEETLDRTCHFFELPSFKKLIDSTEVFDCYPHSMLLLRTWLQNTAYGLTSSQPGKGSDRRLQQLEEELARRLVITIAESKGPAVKPVSRRRDKALKMAVDFIIESDSPVTSINKLSSVSHVSERTLVYAFRERFGQTPKTFTIIYRLNKVKKTLTFADPATAKIHEIAGRHGFFHMGQFTSDYKRLFGELPSETIKFQK